MDIDRLDYLLGRYFDEGLTDETKQELEEMLLASPQARDVFWERARLNAILRQNGQESWGREKTLLQEPSVADSSVAGSPVIGPSVVNPVSKSPEKRSMRRSMTVPGWALAGMVCFVLAGFAALWLSINGSSSIARVESPATKPIAVAETPSKSHPSSEVWVAVLRKAIDVQWQDEANAINVGETISARRIQFDSGLVEIQTNRGALLTLEGPADLELISGMEVRCQAGNLRVDVPPPAIGFLVNTPLVNVVDRGTSFAMDISGDDKAEVHVLEGMVELLSTSADGPQRELHEGQSIGITRGEYQPIASSGTTFPSAAQVTSRNLSAKSLIKQAWNRRREAISNDPSCYLYFDFEDAGGNDTVLRNQAMGATQNTNGTIVGCEWTEGRWPGKKALEFRNVFDRVLFSAPGKHPALTCITSVRLDSMDSTFTSLLAPYSSVEGDFRWLIAPMNHDQESGQLQFGRRSSSGWNSSIEYGSKPCLRREQSGTWIQLALVWDVSSGTCRQYVNGAIVSENMLQPVSGSDSQILRTDHMEIGNWTLAADELTAPIRNFNGRMDELAMFDRALSSEEIFAHYNLRQVTWNNANQDGAWNDLANWSERIGPSQHDAVYIDRDGTDRAVYSEGTSANLNEIRVGSKKGRTGELEITGGTLKATKKSNSNTRVGVAGGHGSVTQRGGNVELNSLQVALDPASTGIYRLNGGGLLVTRGVDDTNGSIDIGAKGGSGSLEITGGSLMTRTGVTLGRIGGIGRLSVHGSRPTGIVIGRHLDRNGFWVQHRGSTLQVLIDDQGVTPIVIEDAANDADGGNVRFANNAIFDVGFLETPRSGTWDVMNWEGSLTDQGLRFSDDVDKNVWSFEFVDTDTSGNPDTLRVTAVVSDQISSQLDQPTE